MAVIKTFFVVAMLLINNTNALNVTLYYETLCPDSIRFITHQLYSTYKLIGNDLNVQLVPFGKATSDNSTGSWEFTCQHGPNECYGNKIQSCAIALNRIDAAIEFVHCASSNDPSSDSDLELCAKTVGVNWNDIKECMKSGQADKLLVENGIRTDSLDPPLRFVPTVIFNEKFNQTLQEEAMNGLLDVCCGLLNNEPDNCESLKEILDERENFKVFLQ